MRAVSYLALMVITILIVIDWSHYNNLWTWHLAHMFCLGILLFFESGHMNKEEVQL